MSELSNIFDKLKSGNFNLNDLKKLTSFIKNQIKYFNKVNFNDEDLNDFINEVIASLVKVLKNSNKEIDKPEAYLRTIIHNELQRIELNHSDILQLLRNIKGILADLKKEGKIHSYNNRKYCIDNYRNSEYSEEEILTSIIFYDFSEINLETRWTERKKELIGKFIMVLLEDIKCIDFNTLVKILRIKLGMNVDRQSFTKTDEDNIDEDRSFENEISMINLDENENIIKEYVDAYEKTLRKFLEQNSIRNNKILKVIYYCHYEEKTLQEIADILSYNSPTTIQVILKNHENLSPTGFILLLDLLDEKINSLHQFLNLLINRMLEVLRQIYIELDDDKQNNEGDKR